jgi:HlyD family secretion protein
MLKLVRELFPLLSPDQRKKFFVLQILVVLMTIGEIVGVAAIAPFMAIVGDMSILQGDGMLADLYLASGINNPQDFAFWLGSAVLILLTLSAGISMLTVWRLSLFATRTGTEIADRLFQHYMQQNWLFHASISSAQLTKQIANESLRVTMGVLQPLMIMNARAVFAISMLLAIFVYKPQVAIVGALILVAAYLLLYKVVRKRLQKNGYAISEMASTRYRLMNDGFGGIKDTLLLGRDGDFVDRFHESGEELAYAQGSNTALSMAPRYLMELVAFGIVIALVLYLFEFYQGNLGAILPVVSVYALAGFKLLPAFQQIYVSVAQIKGNLPAFEAIKDDLKQSKTASGETIRDIEARNDLPFNKCIELIDVDFTYPGKETHALKGLDLSIPANSVVGIVGSSGSGKSTAIDIILGLIAPDRGSLHVDDQTVSGENIRSWQNRIGFVAQSIFLSEGTVAENVAFGIPQEQIDREQVRRALQMAHLLEMIDDLPNGIDSKVGERGIQLSGGQRQRVGIARALYHEADVLIFDEATSALDGITEKMIMDAIHDFRGKKTIIMIAHRLKTVQDCDRIHMMENGRIVDSGSYQQLLETNELFRKMAAHA